MKDSLKLLVSIVGCELVGIISTPFTISAIPSWYALLNKPSFSPPNWVFGPVWTLLYCLMGISLYLILKKKKNNKAVKYFLLQLFFNFLWSFSFFYLKSPILGLANIILLWVLIVSSIVEFYKLSKTAAYILAPYLLWVSFATILNVAIVILN